MTTYHLKVLGVGMGRTGTTSFANAIEVLGIGKLYKHFDAQDRGDFAVLYDCLMKKDLDTIHNVILKDFAGFVEWPLLPLWKEILAANPDSKVILTVRDDAEGWYKSCHETIFSIGKMFAIGMLGYTPLLFSPQAKYSRITFAMAFGGLLGFTDKENCIKKYLEHIEEVKRIVPEHQLLVFNVKEGWEPLCKFLNVPIPEVPFPNVNDKLQMQKRQIQPLRVIGYVAGASYLLIASVIAFFGGLWVSLGVGVGLVALNVYRISRIEAELAFFEGC